MATIDDLTVKFVGDMRDLNGKITTVVSKLDDVGKAAARTSAKVSSGMTAIGRAVTLGLAVTAVRAVGQYQAKLDALGAELVDMSGRANVGIEALQRLRFAADQNGASAAGMDAALLKLNKAMGEARGGSEEMQRAFDALGLMELVRQGAQTDDVMMHLADAFKQINDPALEAAIAAKLMGKSADELVPLLSGGTAELTRMTEAMPDAAVKSADLAHKLDGMNDATQVFNQRIEGVASFLEGQFIYAFNKATDKIQEFNDLMVGNAEYQAPTRLQRNLRAAIALHPVQQLEPKSPIKVPQVRNIFGSDSGGGGKTDKAFEDAKKAAEQYQSVIDDLDFSLAQLGRTEEQAAFQEELRNTLSRAGVDLSAKERAEIEAKVAAIDKLTKSNKKLTDLQQQWKQIGDTIESSFAGAFADMVTGAESAKEAIGNLLQSIGQLIAKQLFLQAIQGITGSVFGEGGLGAALAGIVGGKAGGGTVSPGNSYMVGERGPEMFIPKVPGNIIPNGRTGGGGGVTINSVVNAAPGVNRHELQAVLDQRDAALSKRIPLIMVDKQRRNALGGAFN